MIYPIEDTKVDDIRIEVKRTREPSTSPPVKIIAEGELEPIKHLLEFVHWGGVDIYARQVADATGFGHEICEVFFASNPYTFNEPDIEPFEGVLIVNHFDGQLVVSEAAFYRLMDRFFAALIDIANKRELSVRNDSRWTEFLNHAKRVKELASNR